jgi:hypothetical protein
VIAATWWVVPGAACFLGAYFLGRSHEAKANRRREQEARERMMACVQPFIDKLNSIDWSETIEDIFYK